MVYMSVLLLQDLYQVNPSDPKSQSIIPNNSFQLPSFINLNIGSTVLNISIFIFIWNFFISFLYISDFFYYFKFENEDNFEIEKKAMQRLYLAIRVWVTTLPSLFMIIAAIYWSSSQLVFFSLSILFYIFKIIYDLKLFTKITDYFNWYNDIFTNLRKLRLK